MLGLPALSIFDLVASDLGNAFIGPERERPDLATFTAIRAAVQSIYAINPKPAPTCKAPSVRLRSRPPEDAIQAFRTPRRPKLLNRILWQDARGWGLPYPAVKSSLFFPMTHHD